MNIAHIGAFDHDSYGDLLFPHLVEWRLHSAGASVVHAAPTERTLPWQDALPATTIRTALQNSAGWNGVLIGGGATMADGNGWMPHWNSESSLGPLALPQLWAGAAFVALTHRAHLLWNAPGVPFPLTGAARDLMAWTLSISDHIAVRNSRSLEHLPLSAARVPATVVPDTAFDLARMWPASTLTQSYADLWAREGKPPPSRTVVVFPTTDFMPAVLEDAAETVLRICRDRQATAVLANLCPWSRKSDTERLSDLLKAAGLPILSIPRPTRLREVAACFAHADLYIGSSLHGVISALAYGKPAIAIAPPEAVSRVKIQGTLELCHAPHLVADDWRAAGDLYRQLVERRELRTPPLGELRNALDAHWIEIERILKLPKPSRPPAAWKTLEELNRPWADYEFKALGGLLAFHAQRLATRSMQQNNDANRLEEIRKLAHDAQFLAAAADTDVISRLSRFMRRVFRKPDPLALRLRSINALLKNMANASRRE